MDYYWYLSTMSQIPPGGRARGKWAKKKMADSAKSQFKGKTRAAVLKSNKEGWVWIVTPYNNKFIDELKSDIQPNARKWDPETRRWMVNDIFLEDVVAMLKRYFDEITTDLVEREQRKESDNLFKDLLVMLPKQYREKVYLALANAVHPDHGGTNEQMKKLNEAYQQSKEK